MKGFKKIILLLIVMLAYQGIQAQTLIKRFAGTGSNGYSGDGGLATSAKLNFPGKTAVSSSGELYIADALNNRIRKVDASGIISTVVGTGVAGSSGDGGQALNAKLSGPNAVAFDGAGNLYILDGDNYKIRKVNKTTNIITTVAGNGSAPTGGITEGAQATSTSIYPSDIAVDVNGNIYIADGYHSVIQKVDVTTGEIRTYAGNYVAGYSGDNGLALNAQLDGYFGFGIALNSIGELYIGDANNNRVRKVGLNGYISTVAGNGNPGNLGDGGLATSAQLSSPTGVAVDQDGNIYICDGLHAIRKVTKSDGKIRTFAGNGTAGSVGNNPVLATNSTITQPYRISTDGVNNFYVTDVNWVVSKIYPTVPSPSIVTTGTLTAFNTTYGTSASKSFQLTGSNLTNDVVVTVPSNFKIDVLPMGGGTSTITVPKTSTWPKTLYVTLKGDAPVASSPYSGNVVLTSTGATTKNLAIPSSTVSTATLTITANNITKNSGTSLTSGVGSTAFTSVGLASISNGMAGNTQETIGSVSITYGTGADANASVGTYTGSVVVSAATGGTFTSSNYNINYVAGDLTVISAGPTISYPVGPKNGNYDFVVGTPINIMSATVTGTTTSWTITPALPLGLVFNTTNGEITGTPVTESPSATYTVTATNADGDGTAKINISVGSAPAGLSYTARNLNLRTNQVINTQAASAISTGTLPVLYTVTPALPVGLAINGQTGEITGTPTTVIATSTYTITLTNDYGSSSTSMNIAVSDAPATNDLSFSNSSLVKTYGDSTFKLSATSSSDGEIVYSSSDLNIASVDGNIVTMVSAGTVTITAKQAATDAYEAGEANFALTINKALLTVKVNDTTKIYGDVNPKFRLSYEGLKGSDKVDTSINISGASTLVGIKNKALGTIYKVRVKGSSSGSVWGTGIYTSDSYFSVSAVHAGLLAVGETKDLYVKVVAGQSAYSGTTANGVSTNSYGPWSLSYSYVGAPLFETLPTTTTLATTSSSVGTYTTTATGGSSINYDFTYVDGSLSVSKATLTVKVNDTTKIYGDVNPKFRLSYEGLKGSDKVDTSMNISGATTLVGVTNTALGTIYKVRVKGSLSGSVWGTGIYTSDSYFSVSAVHAGLLAVGETKDLYVKVVAGQSAYSGTTVNGVSTNSYGPWSLSYSYVGTPLFETLPTSTTLATTSSSVGTYSITATGGVSDNYEFSYTTGSLAVTKAPLTITAQDKTKVYGTANPALTLTYTGFKGTDNETSLTTKPTASTSATSATGAGTYSITAAGGVSDNYNFVYNHGKLDITKATLSVTAEDKTKVYGAVNPALTLKYTGFNGTDNETSLTTKPTATTSATSITGVGVYSITAAGGASDNYNFEYNAGKLDITKALLTVTAQDAVRCYNLSNPIFAYKIVGYVNGDDINALTTKPVVTTNAVSNSLAGDYKIIASGALAANYNFSYVDGKLVISDPVAGISLQTKDVIKYEPTVLYGRDIAKAVSYQWSPSNNVLNANTQYPTVSLDKETVYTIKTSLSTGCVTTDSLLVRVFNERTVYLPTVFTPNGDGVNDVYKINPVGIKSLNYFRIFDQWGQVVFQTSNLSEGWDGRLNGVRQPLATYNWIIDASDIYGNPVKESGSVTLIR